MEKINWQKVKKQFERQMAQKLQNLPGHRKVPENLKEFRHIISHELPETTPTKIFQHLIKLLLEGKPVNLQNLKDKYLKPQLEAENEILTQFQDEFSQLKKSAAKWVKENLPEEELKHLWKGHKTWLPRRYTLYKKQVSFQKIAADTLARFWLIKQTGQG